MSTFDPKRALLFAACQELKLPQVPPIRRRGKELANLAGDPQRVPVRS